MKKTHLILSLAAVCSVMVSCEKFDEESVTDDQSTVHTISFVMADESTKTAIVADTLSKVAVYTWDYTPDCYVHLFENGKEGSRQSITCDSLKRNATFAANFRGLPIGRVVYSSVVTSDYRNDVAFLQPIQHPVESSFDPAADILIGKSKVYFFRHIQCIFRLSRAGNVELKHTRVNAVTRLVLAGMNAGENVSLVEMECGSEMAGPLKPLRNGEFQGYDTEYGIKNLTLEFFNNNTVASDGTFETYFTSWSTEPQSFKIKVTTDKGTYTKNVETPGLKLELDVLNNLRFNLEQ